MSLRVAVEDLTASAVAVSRIGEDLACEHSAADDRMDAAQSGWQGRSAAALATKAVEWGKDTRALLSRLAEHAQALHTSAIEFCDHEQRSARALKDQGPS